MEYELIREKRKTLCLRILPDGMLQLKVPRSTGEKQCEQFLASHRRWIEKHRAAMIERGRVRAEFLYLDGQMVPFFGRDYVIQEGPPGFENGMLFLNQQDREKGLAAVYKAQAAQYLPARTALFAEQFHFTYHAVTIGSARGTWGTCARDDRIRYTYRLMALPPDCIDYIILHELCHTVVKNHGPEFYALLASVLPEHKERRAQCREGERRIPF